MCRVVLRDGAGVVRSFEEGVDDNDIAVDINFVGCNVYMKEEEEDEEEGGVQEVTSGIELLRQCSGTG